MHGRLPVAVIVIACNEADRIGRALASVQWADQILVVDSGSTDGTPELAARCGAQVVSHPWEGYARQKAFAVTLTRHRWVLWLDADEEVSPRLRDEIRALFERGDEALERRAAYAVNRRTCYLGRFVRFGGWYPDRKVRLFDRSRARVGDELVHEGLIVDGPVGLLRGDLWHYSYRNLQHHLSKTHEMARLWAAQQGDRRVATWEHVMHPLAKAVKSYYLRAGFLEGWRGLLLAGIACYSVWLKYALLRERSKAP
jgi:glycosyltransferase involved in cell wall biosynthesis